MNPNFRETDPVLRLSAIDLSVLPPDGGEKFNRLVFEKSPYLLQHAENPIDWYPWGEEAFQRAGEEDRPVFISIGYSTCHWCHVMAHESFEDPEVARILNRRFIAVKVDREERPDIDATYMAACQMMTGSGGWPLNLVLAPDKRPFFSATYIPRDTRSGRIGLIPLLEKIAELWSNQRTQLAQTGDEIEKALRRMEKESGPEGEIRIHPLHQAFEHYLGTFDRHHGGFGSAPKFPMPHNLSLLLRYWERTGEERARAMATQTLQAMRLGGIYDQLGYGIHRYSVDERWLVPHFEKMLYDQAMTAMAFLDAWQVSGDDFFEQSSREILEYVRRDLEAPEGGFYCGEDADSEGEEGTYYVWTPREIKGVLGEDPGAVFCGSYGITDDGNFEGKSIPHLAEDVLGLAERAGIDAEQLAEFLGEGRRTLFEARLRRVRPHLDDKIILGWNGLAIAALARAGASLNDPALTASAQRAARFLLDRLRTPEGRLLRRYRRGEGGIPAFLEDYAFLTWGLIELYMASFDPDFLEKALEITDALEELFSDGRGGFYDTGADAEAVLVRGRSLQDGALPSGISVTALNLFRLADLTGDLRLEKRGEGLLRSLLPQAERHPAAFSMTLTALDYALGPRRQIVLVAAGEEDPAEMLQMLRRRFLPRTVVLLKNPRLEPLAPIVGGKEAVDGKLTAYLCRERTCFEPVTEKEKLESLLQG